jgi:hypothetical protein
MKVDRMASVWLIRRRIDPDGELRFTEEAEIASLTAAGWNTFDAKDAKYRHDDDPVLGKYGSRCTFQILVESFLDEPSDGSLAIMGRIVYAADIGHKIGQFEPREGYGLWAIAHVLSLTIPDDRQKMEHALALFDAIHAYCGTLNA